MSDNMRRNVLRALAGVGPGYGLQGSNNEDWQRAALTLMSEGLVERDFGFFSLTDTGRAHVESMGIRP